MIGRTGGTFLCICALAIAGCGAKADLTATKTPGQKPAQVAKGTWAGENKGSSVTLSLQDGRFQAVFKGGDWRSVVKGTTKVDDSAVLLEASEFNGKPATKANEKMPAKFMYSPDWSVLTSEDGLSLQRKL